MCSSSPGSCAHLGSVVPMRASALLELGAGFNPEFTGRENIGLNASLLGLDATQIAERMEQIIAFAEIGEHVDQQVKTYSSGMFVRLAFAVAVHTDPDVLIVDEALSVGDIYFQRKCHSVSRNSPAGLHAALAPIRSTRCAAVAIAYRDGSRAMLFAAMRSRVRISSPRVFVDNAGPRLTPRGLLRRVSHSPRNCRRPLATSTPFPSGRG